MFIGRKLTVSVGEVVNGGPLPPVPRHTPVCSFNSQNKYVGESLATELPISTQKLVETQQVSQVRFPSWKPPCHSKILSWPDA